MKSLKSGKDLREKVSRKSQGDYDILERERTIIELINESNEDRVPELIPIRHQRMSVSPFSFYRGTAGIMAHDLANLPNTNIKVQAIGDCHLMNFGGFASPERILVYDANDFDETLPASWEWDVKRLATSFVLAARENSFSESDAEDLANATVHAYRQQLYEYTQMNFLELWYTKFDLETLRKTAKIPEVRRLFEDDIEKANKQSHNKVFYKITTSTLGNFEINDQPPLVYHSIDVKKHRDMILSFLGQYANSLQDDRRMLFEKYKMIDVAMKVVGVGSVGTRCFVVLFMNEKEEPLFLQVKEARQSVLEPYTSKSLYSHNGERVVQGQRLVQAASDIFLGWSTDKDGRQFYFRQLRDKKISPDIGDKDKVILTVYAKLCGKVLARAHAKTGNADMISAYMGKSDAVEKAIARFAVSYANQTEKDYADFMKAIKKGKLSIEAKPVKKMKTI
jgi:uncharacterized protein (DUF2252 family)